MALYSKAVYNNTPYIKEQDLISEGAEGNPVPMKIGDKSPIKYIFYIIKENRTYDQVLGIFRKATATRVLRCSGKTSPPNQHALAREFVYWIISTLTAK